MGYVVSGTAIPSQNWAVINGVACKNMYVQGALVWQHTVPVTNMLANAGFGTGNTSGWALGGQSIVGGYQAFAVDNEGGAVSGKMYRGWHDTSTGAIGTINQTFTLYAGHIYYIRACVRTTTPFGVAVVRISGTDAANCVAPGGSNWGWRPLRFAWPLASGAYTFTVGGDGHVGQINSAYDLMFVDLTASYGSGAEPSIDTCNSWRWFEGTQQFLA